MPFHLLGLQGLSAADLRALLVAARDCDTLRGQFPGRVFANMFLEDSTRTRTSFTMAAKKIGADTVDLVGSASSVNKGETIVDTARVLEANGVDGIIIRARHAGAAAMVAHAVSCPVINAGDGKHEHPTQGLLDIYTLAEAHGRVTDFDLTGLGVAIVGDVAASRVARSALAGLTTLGARVVCVGPPNMVPSSLQSLGVTVSRELDPVLAHADAVMMLRIQFERYGDANPPPAGAPAAAGPRSNIIPSVREFREFFALTSQRARGLKPGAVVMHPGPINRGIELDAEVADGPHSVILKQVANGQRVRMAVLGRAVARR